MENEIVAWLDFVSLNLAPRTVVIYGGELRRLAARYPGKAPGEFVESDLTHFLAERRAGGVGPSGIGQAVGAFRRFFKWCHSGAAAGIPFPAVEERTQRTLSELEVTAVLEGCDTATGFGVRDLAMFMLLWDSGIRSAELCGLQLSQLKIQERMFTVMAKGYRGRRRERFGAFSEETANQLLTWLAFRERAARPETTTVFCSLGGSTSGRPITRRGLQDICQSAAERAGVPRFAPHAFRRGLAVAALEAGAPDEVLVRFMGWKSARMVGVYTRALSAGAFRPYLGMPRLLAAQRAALRGPGHPD